MQPNPRHGPVSFDSRHRDLKHLCYFGRRQSAEELHLHNFALSIIDLRLGLQGIVQRHELLIPGNG